MMTNALRKEIFANFEQTAKEEGVTLSREHRRRLKRLQRHKPKVRETRARGLGLLATRYVKATPIEEERRNDLISDYYAAIDAVTSGRAMGAHVDVFVYAVNIAYFLTMIDPGLGKQHRTRLIKPALEAVHRMNERYAKHGKYAFDGEGLQAIKAFAELHEAQMENATQGEIDAAIQEMHDGIKNGFVFKFEAEEDELEAA